MDLKLKAVNLALPNLNIVGRLYLLFVAWQSIYGCVGSARCLMQVKKIGTEEYQRGMLFIT